MPPGTWSLPVLSMSSRIRSSRGCSDGRSLSKVTQGVTSEILGEAWTPAPVGGENTSAFGTVLRSRGEEFAREWEERGDRWTRFDDWLADQAARGASVNFGSFLGGSTVRRYGDGRPGRRPFSAPKSRRCGRSPARRCRMARSGSPRP